MDYKRIYAEFIKDRLAKQPTAPDYFEVHHIVPRCYRGSDATENLIALTPEDHYFAHLLLAQVHKGKMISALWRMLQSSPTTWGRKEAARRSYGLARRMVVKHLRQKWTKAGNPLFNETVFEWCNYRTNEEVSATLFDMHERFGASRPSWTSVANGDRPSIKGWLLKSRLATHKRSEKGKEFHFVNRDGREFVGTQGAFCRAHGIGLPSAHRIVRRESVTECGWRRLGVSDRRHNLPKNGSRGGATGTGRIYRLSHRDGRVFEGNSDQFRVYLGKPEGFSMSVRLSGLMRGAAPTLYGWSLDSAAKRNKHPVDTKALPGS